MVRRVVTGYTQDGRPAVLADDELPDLRMDLFPGCTFRPLWGTDSVPADLGSAEAPATWFPQSGGIRVALSGVDAVVPTLPDNLDMDVARQQVVDTIPDMLTPFDPDGSGRHRTDSVDVVVVVEGSVILELDDGSKTLLCTGDVAVQQGTAHVWHPQPGAPLRLVTILVGAQGGPMQTNHTDRSAPDVRTVADELAIRNLVARVAQLTDDGEPDDYAACFTEDATWDMPGAPWHGRDDIRTGLLDRRAIKACGPGTDSRHMMTTLSVSVDGSDKATAESTFMFCTELGTGPIIRATGRYSDDFVRTDAAWQLLHRRIMLDITG